MIRVFFVAVLLFLFYNQCPLYAQSLEWISSGSGLGIGAVINGNPQQGSSVIEKNGNVYIAGLITGQDGSAVVGEVTIDSVVYAGFLAKYDGKGSVIWVKKLSTVSPNFITVDDAENIYVAGYNQSQSDAILLRKYDSEGNLIWEKPALVNTLLPIVKGIAIDNQNNLIVAGQYKAISDSFTVNDSLVTGMKGFAMGYLLKYSSDGNFLWFRSTNVSNQEGACEIKGIDVNQQGDIYFTGQAKLIENDTLFFGSNLYVLYQNIGLSDAFVGKIDKSGEFQWLKQISGEYDQSGNQVCVDNQDNVYVTGAFSIEIIIDGLSVKGKGNNDFFVAKLAADNTLEWIRTASSIRNEGGLAIEVDNNGDVYLGGYLNVNTVFYNESDSVLITDYVGAGSEEVHFLAKYNPQGQIAWITHANYSSSNILDIYINEDDSRLYFTGYFSPSASFDGQTIPTINRNTDNFMIGSLDISTITNIADEEMTDNEITVYPIPTKDYINIRVGSDINGSWQYLLYSSQGDLIKDSWIPFSQKKALLDFSTLNKGTYTLVLIKNERKVTKRILIK